MLCRECGHENPAGYRFCGLCGRPHPVRARDGARYPRTEAQRSWPTPPAQQPWVSEQVPEVTSAAPRPRDESGTAITRYLCAAVTMDPVLARRAIEDILEERHRAVVTTPGVDLATVMKYALAADHRRVVRDSVLLALLCAIVGVLFIRPSWLESLLALSAAWVVVFAERWASRYGSVVRGLQPGAFMPERVRGPARDSYAHRQLQRVAAAGTTTGNVTLYSGFPPFTGYGKVLTSWSFAVDVTRSRRDGTARPFSVHEIYNHVKAGLLALDAPGMVISDRLFVNGRDIDDDRRFLPDTSKPPVTSVPPELMRDLIACPDERARPYLTVSQASWQGDLITTTFVRFVLSRSDLFVEAAHTVVPPLRREFKAIDEGEIGPTAHEFFPLAGGALIGTVPRLIGSVPGIFQVLVTEARRERKSRLAARARDYGPLLSVREAAADSHWQRYFQKLDDARYVKVVEQRVFRCLLEFLDAHDIDTSGVANRTETLINSGVMVTDQVTLQAEQPPAGAGVRAVSLLSRLRGQDGAMAGAGGGR
jgi:hypothetical protein